mgnify:CR=1 FL=1
MAGENLFTQIPPASTGDRIQLRQSIVLPYGNKGGIDFILEDYYILETSGIKCHLHQIYATNSSNGNLWLHFSPNDLFNGLVPTTGENINDLEGNTIATVTAGYYSINTNANTTVGYNNPNAGQFVDQFGSAYVRTEEGNLGLDAFGKLRTSGATLLGEYIFGNGLLPQLFSNTISGSGEINWNQNGRYAEIQLGTDNQAQITQTSNTYHHYLPGSSHQFIGTFALGDTGKAGLVRNWGLFDEANGFMFTTRGEEFGVVVRSSVTGTKVDTFIPQSDFDNDTVDGTGLSQMNINLTYDNIYWIDVQWLGGGRVRFGTYYKGARIVMHEYYGGNVSINAISQQASLPTCFAMKNTTGTASPSTMKSWCQAVYTETTFDIEELGAPNNTSLGSTIPSTTPTGSYHYIGTLSPKQYNVGTQFNRSLYFPTSIDVQAWDKTTGDPVLLEIEVYANPVLSGISLLPAEYNGTVEKDISATFFGGTNNAVKSYIRGEKVIDLTHTYTNITYGAFKNNAEQGGTIYQNITNITTSTTASATFDISSQGQATAREGNLYTISGVNGMTEINGKQVYLKLTGTASAELYNDSSLTSGVDTTTSGSYTSAGKLQGLYGSQNYFTLVAQKPFSVANDIEVKCVINWREIDQ